MGKYRDRDGRDRNDWGFGKKRNRGRKIIHKIFPRINRGPRAHY